MAANCDDGLRGSIHTQLRNSVLSTRQAYPVRLECTVPEADPEPPDELHFADNIIREFKFHKFFAGVHRVDS